MVMIMTKHKWHKEIKAWADGAEIESKFDWTSDPEWYLNDFPDWDAKDVIFRIKSQPKKPQYLYVYKNGYSGEPYFDFRDGLNENAGTYIGKIKLEQDNE